MGAAPNFFFSPSDMLCFDLGRYLGRYLTYIPISMMNKYGCDDSKSDSCTFSCCTVFFGEGGYFCVCVCGEIYIRSTISAIFKWAIQRHQAHSLNIQKYLKYGIILGPHKLN